MDSTGGAVNVTVASWVASTEDLVPISIKTEIGCFLALDLNPESHSSSTSFTIRLWDAERWIRSTRIKNKVIADQLSDQSVSQLNIIRLTGFSVRQDGALHFFPPRGPFSGLIQHADDEGRPLIMRLGSTGRGRGRGWAICDTRSAIVFSDVWGAVVISPVPTLLPFFTRCYTPVSVPFNEVK